MKEWVEILYKKILLDRLNNKFNSNIYFFINNQYHPSPNYSQFGM